MTLDGTPPAPRGAPRTPSIWSREIGALDTVRDVSSDLVADVVIWPGAPPHPSLLPRGDKGPDLLSLERERTEVRVSLSSLPGPRLEESTMNAASRIHRSL